MDFRRTIGPYRGLPRGVYVLALANVLNNLGNFVWPLLALLLTQKLGYNEAEAGFFLMLMMAVSAIGLFVGGKLADHLGRRGVFLVSRLLGAACFVPCAFLGASPAIPWLILASSAVGSAAWPCFNAMAADLAPPEQRQSAYSLLYLGLNLGFAIGPMLAGFLFHRYMHWLFLGDALSTVISSFYVYLTLSETVIHGPCGGEETSAEAAEQGGLIRALLHRPALVVFAFILMALSFVYSQFAYGLPLQAAAVFGEAAGGRVYGSIMGLNALIVIVCTAPLTHLTRRFRSELNMGAGALCYALGFGMIGLIGDSLGLFALSTAVWTFGEILITTNAQAYTANHSPLTHRGRFNAFMEFATGIGRALGPWLMGRLALQRDIGAVWPVCFCLAAPLALIFYFQAARAKVERLPLDASPPGA